MARGEGRDSALVDNEFSDCWPAEAKRVSFAQNNTNSDRTTMPPEQDDMWEDSDHIYVPEELFKHFPEEYREALQARKEEGERILRIVDKDLKNLVRLINAIPTTSSLSYIFHRLRTEKFSITSEAWMEQEVLTTAFIVNYGRLFAKGDGASGLSERSIPIHLRPVHDEIIDLRNRRYAHNASHETVNSAVNVLFDDEGFEVKIQMSLGSYIGGKDEWEELITFIDALMHKRLSKILDRLREKTGYAWKFPAGPAPDWVGNYGKVSTSGNKSL